MPKGKPKKKCAERESVLSLMAQIVAAQPSVVVVLLLLTTGCIVFAVQKPLPNVEPRFQETIGGILAVGMIVFALSFALKSKRGGSVTTPEVKLISSLMAEFGHRRRFGYGLIVLGILLVAGTRAIQLILISADAEGVSLPSAQANAESRVPELVVVFGAGLVINGLLILAQAHHRRVHTLKLEYKLEATPPEQRPQLIELTDTDTSRLAEIGAKQFEAAIEWVQRKQGTIPTPSAHETTDSQTALEIAQPDTPSPIPPTGASDASGEGGITNG